MPRRMRSFWHVLFAVVLTLVMGTSCRFLPRRTPRARIPPAIGISLYFHRSGSPDAPPVPVERRIRLARATSGRLVREGILFLLGGPTKVEKETGYFSSLPADTTLKSARVERPLAQLDFSRELEQTGGTARVAAILDELAYTTASVPGVKGVILMVEGERVGTDDHPFTGEGFLFTNLHPPADSNWAARLAPADALDLFIAAIPDPQEMWKLMGPKARKEYGSPKGIDWAAFTEGIGSWRGYRIARVEVKGNEATVEIAGRRIVEGEVQPDARYEAHLVREDGRWKWELP